MQIEATPDIDLGLKNTLIIAELEREVVKMLNRINSITQNKKIQIKWKE